MIRRALSHLLDLTSLARAVHRLASERDALATLAGQLEGELQHATDAAEALRHELADRTAPGGDCRACGEVLPAHLVACPRVIEPPRDAATPENRVLALAYRARDTWGTDVEGPALRRQLQAAEVELAAARAEVATVRRELGEARREVCDLSLEPSAHRSTKAILVLADDRSARLARHARALSRAARVMARAERDYHDWPRTLVTHAMRSWLARDRLPRAQAEIAPPSSTQDADDAPPPTQPSERRPVEPAPERAVRVASSS